ARLTADIDMQGVSYEGIGTPLHPFTGELDGGRHTISRLTMNRTGESAVGLVNVGGNGLELHDLTLSSNCTITGYSHIGGFVGRVTGENGGVVRFRNLGFEGRINVNNNGGAIVGCVPNNDFETFFSSCYSIGTVSGTSDNGALSGWSSNARLENCYVVVKGSGWESGSSVVRGFSPRFINCYAKGQKQDGLTSFTTVQMQDGTLLQWLRSDVFSQEVGVDNHPVIRPQTPTLLTSPEDSFHPATGIIYDLSGREIASPRGIYILNGRKFLRR
ncbi:MAG: hypothetical protein HUK03_03425, partial [Bacteroidaceae bacterium]|nr:hypothetical protein [Bacteroidaceae bacterium]